MIRTPDAVVTVKRGTASVDVRRKDLVVEVRDYDVEGTNNAHPSYWIDENDVPCTRTYVNAPDSESIQELVGRHLERFADDLQYYTNLKTSVDLTDDVDLMHVVQIQGVDFYFYANGTGYDGWGRAMPSPGGNGS